MCASIYHNLIYTFLICKLSFQTHASSSFPRILVPSWSIHVDLELSLLVVVAMLHKHGDFGQVPMSNTCWTRVLVSVDIAFCTFYNLNPRSPMMVKF